MEFVAPRTPTEKTLAEIWSNVLGLEADQIGVYDNFFDIGGHSLLAIQILSRLRETFSEEFPLHYLFEAPTVAELTELLDRYALNNNADSIDSESQSGSDPLEEEREELAI